MERRRFLQLLGLGVGGVAIEQAIPLGRVWSFPKEIVIARPAMVRFIRAWDINRRMMLGRLDVLYGFTGSFDLPKIFETAELITVPSEKLVGGAIEALIAKHDIPVAPQTQIDGLSRQSKNDPEIRGFWYEEPRLGLTFFATPSSP